MHGRAKSDLEQEMLVKAQREIPPVLKTSPAYWTIEEIRDLKWLYKQGKTFGQIARRLGRPRSSIAGKVMRLRRDGEL
jgi:hypothetical protein